MLKRLCACVRVCVTHKQIFLFNLYNNSTNVAKRLGQGLWHFRVNIRSSFAVSPKVNVINVYSNEMKFSS